MGTVFANKEVILCCGPINSPMLLMGSGVGPKEHLEEIEVDCVQDLPVGENLQDQLFVPLSFSVQSKHFSLDYVFSQPLAVSINYN